MSICSLKTFIEIRIPAITESARTPVLTSSCQTGTPVTPNRNITWTGAVTGKIVRMTHTGLSGKKRIVLPSVESTPVAGPDRLPYTRKVSFVTVSGSTVEDKDTLIAVSAG